MFKGVGFRFADFISLLLNIPYKWNNLASLRPNYFIFIGYLKSGGGWGEGVEPSGSATARDCSIAGNEQNIKPVPIALHI